MLENCGWPAVSWGELLSQAKERLCVLFTSKGKVEREVDGQFGAAPAAYVPSLCGEEEAKAKLWIYYIPTLTYGHQ